MNDEQRPSEQPGAGKATGEEALRESEEQYRALFETMAQGVVYQDAAGRITDANPAAEKILGLSLEQMQGRTSVDPRWRAIHEDGSDFPGETHPAIVALKTGREVRDVVMGVFNPAKEAYSWIMINAAPQSHSDEERPHRVYTTFDDVTKRKQAEEALRESEAQNRALISAFPDILFTNRRDGEFLAVHTSHPELLFAPPETFLHRKVEEIMPKPLADQFMKAFANSLDLETVQELNYALPVGSEQRRLEARVTPCAKDTVITIVRDITERMRAEEALQKSEAKLSNALQMAHAGHWEYDVDRDIFTFNDNFYRIFRTTAAEVGGCQMSSADYARRFCYPDDIAVVANETRAAIESTDPNYSRQIEHRILYADGEVGVITVRFFIVKDPQGRTIKTYGVNQDITERRRAEVLLRESESSLQAILQSTADGFLAVDRENRVLLANGRFEEMWKIPQEIMTSKDDAVLLQYILDQLIDPQGFLQKVQQLYASEEDSFDTLSFKDGRIFERLSRPLMAGTELRGRVWSFRDITERKQAEEALQIKDWAIESATNAIVTSDMEGNLNYVNPAFLKLWGHSSPEEVLGKPAVGFWQMGEKAAEVMEAVRTKGGWIGELVAKGKDGALFDVLATSSMVVNAAGQPICMQASFADITDRKQAEEKLQESEQRYRLLIETANEGILVAQGASLKFVNPIALELTGYTEGELLSLPFLELIHHDDRELARNNYLKRLKGEAVEPRYQFRVLKKDKSIRWVEMSGVKIEWEGQPATMNLVTDITDRKQAEDTLRESEEKYRLLIETMQDGVYRSSYEGKLIEVNPAMVKMLGYESKEELLAIDIKSQLYFAPEDRESAALVEKLEEMGVFRLRKKDGSEIWVEDHGRHVVNDEGAVLYHEGVLRDITERKQAEEALRDMHRRLENIIEGTHVGTWEWNVQNGETVFNEVWAQIIGYTLDELAPISIKTWEAFAHPDDLKQSDELLERHFAGELPYYDYESRMKHKDGRWIWVLDRGRVITRTGDGKPLMMFGTHTNITDRKQLEERIRQVRSDLLFAVSHDLKSPLQALNQTQEMLNELTPGEGLARFQEYSEIWRRNLQRLERMINNLMDSQRTEEGRFSLLLAPCNLVELIKRVAEDLTGYALALQVTFDLNLQPVPEGACDEEALTRVVENLLTNAVKFSPKGRKVEVRLEMEEETLLLEVEDHGAGIPANEQAQLFQPFQRGRSAQQKRIPGTGLGLYVSRRIVEEHGGAISLTSEEGKGTIVTVRLPWKKVGIIGI